MQVHEVCAQRKNVKSNTFLFCLCVCVCRLLCARRAARAHHRSCPATLPLRRATCRPHQTSYCRCCRTGVCGGARVSSTLLGVTERLRPSRKRSSEMREGGMDVSSAWLALDARSPSPPAPEQPACCLGTELSRQTGCRRWKIGTVQVMELPLQCAPSTAYCSIQASSQYSVC